MARPRTELFCSTEWPKSVVKGRQEVEIVSANIQKAPGVSTRGTCCALHSLRSFQCLLRPPSSRRPPLSVLEDSLRSSSNPRGRSASAQSHPIPADQPANGRTERGGALALAWSSRRPLSRRDMSASDRERAGAFYAFADVSQFTPVEAFWRVSAKSRHLAAGPSTSPESTSGI